MFRQPTQISFDLPDWLQTYAQTYKVSTDLHERMRFVINASLKIPAANGPPVPISTFFN